MPNFFENMKAEEKTGRAWSYSGQQHKTYFVYDGPYWGIWKYKTAVRRLSWQPWSPRDLRDYDIAMTRELQKEGSYVPVTSPVGPGLLRGLEQKNWGTMMRSPSKNKFLHLVHLHREHREQMDPLWETLLTLCRVEAERIRIHPMADSAVLTALHFGNTNEVASWLAANPKRINALRFPEQLRLGKQRRLRAYKLLPQLGLKKTIRTLYPKVPGSVINRAITGHNLHGECANWLDKYRADPGENSTYFIEQAFKHATRVSHYKYICRLSATNSQLLGWWNELMQDNWRGESAIQQEFKQNPWVPPSEIRRYHRLWVEELHQQAHERARISQVANAEKEQLFERKYASVQLVVPTGMKLLKTRKEFNDEGTAMHHCLSAYFGNRILPSSAKIQTFYSITTQNERASMQLGTDGTILQLYAACNKPVGPETKALVKEFLCANGFDVNQSWVQ